MSLKIFNFFIWMFFISFTAVKGSCKEFGHSCWGGHGKRSSSNKVYYTDVKTSPEVDYQDFNGFSGKNTYDELPERDMDKSNTLAMISERWRLVPLYKKRHIQFAKPANWLRELNLDYI